MFLVWSRPLMFKWTFLILALLIAAKVVVVSQEVSCRLPPGEVGLVTQDEQVLSFSQREEVLAAINLAEETTETAESIKPLRFQLRRFHQPPVLVMLKQQREKLRLFEIEGQSGTYIDQGQFEQVCKQLEASSC